MVSICARGLRELPAIAPALLWAAERGWLAGFSAGGGDGLLLWESVLEQARRIWRGGG